MVSSTDLVAPASNSPAVKPAPDVVPAGLTNEEARTRLAKDGPNAMPDTSAHPLRNALAKFWAPVPWLLEASVVLEIVLHKYYEAAVIAALLLFNAALAYFQESRAQATLAALKSRLALNASVHRDGEWKTVPAAELVCGDLVKLSLGGVVAADVHLTGGSVELDQSMLTGESLPIDAGAGTDTFAGALVRRGEATAIVTATGTRTKFGRTAELVRSAHVVSTQQKAVLKNHPQPGSLQLPHHRCNGILCPSPCNAIERDDSVAADLGPGHYPGCLTCNIHPRSRDWGSNSCEAGCVANTAFRCGRSSIDRCVVL